MLINELLQQLKELDNQQAEIKQKKKDLIAKAHTEKVLEICLYDLVKELQIQTSSKNFAVKINPIFIPNALYNKTDEAKNFIIKNNTGLGIRIGDIHYFQLNISIKDTKLSDNTKLIDCLKFDKTSHTMKVPNQVISKIMINIDLNNSNMEKPFFKQAVISCVEAKEKHQIENK